jgi:cell division protein FtsI (penicillin-binding protein 3)
MSKESVQMRRRLLLVGLILLLGFPILLGRLVQIQLLEGFRWRQLGQQQAYRHVDIPARRGAIYDSQGRVLATLEVRYRVAVDPKVSRFAESASALYNRLAQFSGRDPDFYARRVRQAGSARYVLLESGLPEQEARQLERERWPGLILERRLERTYPYRQLAAHVLGYVNLEGNGVAGVEAYYDSLLRGHPGRRLVRRDRLGRLRPLVGAPEVEPRHGQDVVLTLDLRKQAIVEAELANGVRTAGADWGVAILMDPHTGAIRAWAVYPAYDPNRPGAVPVEWLRNRAITDPLEPGSTFKLVTALAALERGVVRPEMRFPSGFGVFRGIVMRDPEDWGAISLAEALARSSNVALAHVAERAGKGALYQMARNLGFGSRTGIDLPGEVGGRLKKPSQWSGTTLYWMAIGYEVAVTPLQLLCAYAAVANGGLLMRPYLVAERRDPNTGRRWITRPQVTRRVCSPESARIMRELLMQVVERGTGVRARLEELSVAGKTGTAKVVQEGRYEAQYRAMFVGFFPAQEPRAVLLVMIGHPRGAYYAGEVVAPVFRRIAYRLGGLMPDVQRLLASSAQADGYPAEARLPVPNLVGLPLEQAQELCAALYLKLEASEEEAGWVQEQQPRPGTLVPVGSAVRVRSLRRPGPMPELVGLPLRWAVEALERSGVRVSWEGWGKVVRQEPNPGAAIPPRVHLIAGWK